MAKGFIGSSGCKAYLGAVKMQKGYIGAARVYSAGNIVTYCIDSGISYREEVDAGTSCLAPKSFTPAKSGWTFVGWRQDTAANGSVLNSLSMGDEPITLYAVFSQAVTVTYYNGSTSAKQWSKNRYYNTNHVENPTFSLTQNAISGWTARGWSTSPAAAGGISYNNGAAFTRDSDIILYGMYQQTVTLSYHNGSAPSSTSGTRYYNSNGNTVNPSFTLNPASIPGWTFRGWATSSAAAAGISYNSISGTSFAASTTVYAAYYQTITLSYSGNGAAGGSTAAQTGTRYYNSGNYQNPTFVLSANGFSHSGYTFSRWALGSAGGTQYTAGASVTLSANTIMYAVWTAAPFTLVPDAGGWTKRISQGRFSSGPNIIANPYGRTGVEVSGTGTSDGTTAFAIGGYYKTIATRGLSKVDIKFDTYSRNQGGIIIGGIDINCRGTSGGATLTANINAAESQELYIYINSGGDTYHSMAIVIESLYFHD